jgi:hypothetical protein
MAGASSGGAIDVPSVEEPFTLEGQWRLHVGDADDRTVFAAPQYDDSAWPLVDVPGGLGEQGHRDLVGVYWLRVTLRLRAPATRELSLRLAPIDSAGQVFIDGVLAGSIGRVDEPIEDAHDMMSIWPIPVASTADGEVVIALRCVRTAARADSTPARGGIFGGPIWIGTTSDVVRAQFVRSFDKIIAGAVVLMVALYHLHLFRRRREEAHYLWFGLFAFCMGVYLLVQTEESIALLGTDLNARIFWLSLMGTFPSFLQFIWPLLGRPIRWWWRINQCLTIGFGVLAALWPSGWFADKFIVWVELLLILPVIMRILVGVVMSAWRGDPEARTLLLGTFALVLAAVGNIIMERTTLPIPQLSSYAMVVFVFSIAVSLANRFSRLYRALDEKNQLKGEVRLLNAQLQENVRSRSEDLSSALAKLASHNNGRGAQGAFDEGVRQGSIIDERFAIDRLLGVGGMGAVYAGRDVKTDAAVAIKVIKASGLGELEALHRFLREARAAAAVDHPAVVRMLHVALSNDGFFYQAQELVLGVTLEERLKAGIIAAPQVARCGAVLADALAAAHDKGVIHRDVKPSNVMLTALAPGVKLLDFGVAKITSSPSDHTGTGRHIGTPAYMAPELRHIAAADVTDKVDVYALGIVLHRMAFGGLPGRVLDVKTDERLMSIIERCIAEHPERRPSSRALSDELAIVATKLDAPEQLSWPEETTSSGITDLMLNLVR